MKNFFKNKIIKNKMKKRELKSYINLNKITENIDEIKEDIEKWINLELDFLILFEESFNNKIKINDDEYIYLDFLLKNNPKLESFFIYENDLYIHPIIFIAYSMSIPTLKIQLITTLFTDLDEKILFNIIEKMFNV
jgi:hypothetical protein